MSTMPRTSVLQMQPQRPEARRAAIAVVARIADVLKIRTDLPAHRPRLLRPHILQAIVAFQYLLTAVAQAAVIQQKPGSARSQIVAMSGRERFADQRQAEAIVGAMPMGTRELSAERRHLLHLGEGEALRMTVIPAPAQKHSRGPLVRQRRLRVDTEAILVASLPIVGDDVRGSTAGRGDRQRG